MYTIIWHLPTRDLSPPENVEQIKRAEKEVWNNHKLLQKKWIVSSDQACIIDLVLQFPECDWFRYKRSISCSV